MYISYKLNKNTDRFQTIKMKQKIISLINVLIDIYIVEFQIIYTFFLSISSLIDRFQ